MAEEITRALARLRADADRCAPLPAVAIRRRGERRRTAARAVAVGGTVALVGTTVGTAVAVSDETGSGHHATQAAGRSTDRNHSAEIAKLRAKLESLRAQLTRELQKAQQIGPSTPGDAPAVRIPMLRREIGEIRTRIAVVRHEGDATPVPSPHLTQPTASPTAARSGSVDPIATPHPGLSTVRPSSLATPTPTPTHR